MSYKVNYVSGFKSELTDLAAWILQQCLATDRSQMAEANEHIASWQHCSRFPIRNKF